MNSTKITLAVFTILSQISCILYCQEPPKSRTISLINTTGENLTIFFDHVEVTFGRQKPTNMRCGFSIKSNTQTQTFKLTRQQEKIKTYKNHYGDTIVTDYTPARQFFASKKGLSENVNNLHSNTVQIDPTQMYLITYAHKKLSLKSREKAAGE